MSYILDALRRADAERGRGAVPDLNAQHLVLAVADHESPIRAPKPWIWLAAVVGLLLLLVAMWKFGGDEPGAAVVPVPTPTPTPTPSPPAAPIVAPVPAAPSASLPSVVPAPKSVATPSVPKPKPKPKPNPAAAAAAPKPAPTPKLAASALPVKIPTLAELPEDIKRDVPALALGGSVYSAQPASRMVIVNGQVFREGDTLAPGLTLERIQPKSAVFVIRGQRFELRF